jgi:protein O-mannosyl-transferase
MNKNIPKYIQIAGACSVLVLAVLCVYVRSLWFDLTYLDDNIWILDYHWYIKEFSNMLKFFTSPDFISDVFYRPLLNASFSLDAFLYGQNLKGYHASNLIIHSVNVWLVFYVFTQWMRTPRQAFWWALVFAIHPVLVPAVVWIPGRTDSLLGLMVLLSVIGFMHYMRKPRGIFLGIHLLFFGCALLVKETAIMIPVVCISYVFLRVSPLPSKKVWGSLIVAESIVLGVWGLVRCVVLRSAAQQVSVTEMVSSMAHNSPALISYVGKVLCPLHLSTMPIIQDMSLKYGMASILVVALLLTYTKEKDWRRILFGIIWFCVFLMPSLVISFIEHEYRLYVPILGCFLILAEIQIIGGAYARSKKKLRIQDGVMVVVSVALAYGAVQYSKAYSDRHVFWNNAVAHSPHCPLAQRNLAAVYQLAGDKKQAAEHYKKALTLNPTEPMVHNNLGLIAMDQGDLRTAEEEFQKEISINPTYDNVYFNLGILLYKQQRLDEALKAWEYAVQYNDNNLAAYQNLYALHHYLGNSEEAQKYGEALQRKGGAQ